MSRYAVSAVETGQRQSHGPVRSIRSERYVESARCDAGAATTARSIFVLKPTQSPARLCGALLFAAAQSQPQGLCPMEPVTIHQTPLTSPVETEKFEAFLTGGFHQWCRDAHAASTQLKAWLAVDRCRRFEMRWDRSRMSFEYQLFGNGIMTTIYALPTHPLHQAIVDLMREHQSTTRRTT